MIFALTFLFSLFIGSSLNDNDPTTINNVDQLMNSDNSVENLTDLKINQPKSAALISDYPWWNERYAYRIMIVIDPNDVQHDYPGIELYLNFSQHLVDNGVTNQKLNTTNIRLIEQTTDGYTKSYHIQYDQTYPFTSDNGELAWIIDETFVENKTFFVYFCTGPTDQLGDPITPSEYTHSITNNPFRIYHQGFEHPNYIFESGTSGGQDVPATGEVIRSIDTNNRGNAGLRVRGNRWPLLSISSTTNYAIHNFAGAVYPSSFTSLYITYSFKIIDNPPASIEIVGIGFQPSLSLASDTNYYQTHWGNQNWGSRIPVSTVNTWFYYARNVKAISGLSTSYFNWIAISNDDDGSPSSTMGCNWDDISLWNVTVKQHPTVKPIADVIGLQKVSSNFQIKVLDLEGFPVPDAEVFISNEEKPYWDQNSGTSSSGIVTFTNVSISQMYNITIKYEAKGVTNPIEFQIGYSENVVLTAFNFNITVHTSLWSMDFKVKDFDQLAITNGFVILYDDEYPDAKPIANASLDTTGSCTIRYQNTSKAFNYSVFIDNRERSSNEVYKDAIMKIYNSTIERDSIDQPQKVTWDTNVIQPSWWNDMSSANRTSYDNTTVYGTLIDSAFGDTKFGSVVFEMINFTDNIIDYSIGAYLSDSSYMIMNSSSASSGPNMTIYFEGYEMKGIDFSIRKNTGAITPYINLTYYPRTTEFITANLTQYTFNITAYKGADQSFDPLANAIAIFRDQNNNSIANITTTTSGIIELTYFRFLNADEGNYSVKVVFIGVIQSINQTEIGDLKWNTYNNFTMNTARQIDILVDFEARSYTTSLNVVNFNPSSKIYLAWGTSREITLNYSLYTSGTTSSDEAVTADEVTYYVRDEDYGLLATGTIDPTGTIGLYNWVFNSGQFIGGRNYYVQFDAIKTGYPALSHSDELRIEILNLNTTRVLYDQSTGQPIDGKIVEKKWGEKFNITLTYSSDSTRLSNAITSITADFISTTSLLEVGTGNNLNYTFEIDTATAPTLGQYLIELTMSLQNYTSNSTQFFLKILPIPTTINSTAIDMTNNILRISKNVNETDQYLFNFTYIDSFNSEVIANYTTAEFTWDYTTEGDSGNGILLANQDGTRYCLDFNMTTRSVGSYIILVTINKENYEQRQVIIFLTIEKRIISYSLTGDFVGTNLRKVQGDDWNLTIKLRDQSRKFIPLENAIVKMEISSIGYTFNFTETAPGIYTIISNWSILKSIFKAGNYDASITIQKETFTPVPISIPLTVSKRTTNPVFQGDFDGTTQITKVKGNNFHFQIQIKDAITGEPIENAKVSLVFGDQLSRTLDLVHIGDGVYEIDENFEDVEVFTRDVPDQGILTIEIEDYETVSQSIVVTIKMEEIMSGVPKFYLILGISAVLLLVGTIGGYRAVQNAKIPGFVKTLNKEQKLIESKKVLSDKNAAPSRIETIYEIFADDWRILDLDLKSVLDLQRENSEGKEYITTSDEGGN